MNTEKGSYYRLTLTGEHVNDDKGLWLVGALGAKYPVYVANVDGFSKPGTAVVVVKWIGAPGSIVEGEAVSPPMSQHLAAALKATIALVEPSAGTASSDDSDKKQMWSMAGAAALMLAVVYLASRVVKTGALP
jgi:hypothetical protein